MSSSVPCSGARAQPRARAPPFCHVQRSSRATGIFHGVYQMHSEGRFDEGDAAWLWEEMHWFNQHLPAPRVAPDPRAVFWFRRDAGEALTRIWRFVRIAERAGVPATIYRTRRPGIVVYSDDFQIAAVPWRDTFAERAH